MCITRFDVIVPIFKSAAYLERALDSIAFQTHKEWDCWVIDGAPEVGEGGIVARYLHDPRFHYLEQDRSTYPHLSGARNQAIAQGSHAHIALLDSDDIWRPEHLAELASAWEDHPESALVWDVGEYDQVYTWESTGEQFSRRHHLPLLTEVPPPCVRWVLALHTPHLFMVPSVVSFRRDHFETLDGFPPVKFEEDVAFFSLLLYEYGDLEVIQIPFAGVWLDWIRGGDKVSTIMHGAEKPRLLQDREFYSMPWYPRAQRILTHHEEIMGTPYGDVLERIVAGEWAW